MTRHTCPHAPKNILGRDAGWICDGNTPIYGCMNEKGQIAKDETRRIVAGPERLVYQVFATIWVPTSEAATLFEPPHPLWRKEMRPNWKIVPVDPRSPHIHLMDKLTNKKPLMDAAPKPMSQLANDARDMGLVLPEYL